MFGWSLAADVVTSWRESRRDRLLEREEGLLLLSLVGAAIDAWLSSDVLRDRSGVLAMSEVASEASVATVSAEPVELRVAGRSGKDIRLAD